MNRSAPKPSPALDWQALAKNRLQQRSPLERITAPLTIMHTTDRDGRAFTEIFGIGEGAKCHSSDLL